MFKIEDRNFYFVPTIMNMRYGASRLLETVASEYGIDSKNGDAFVFFNRNGRHVKIVYYENHAFHIFQKTYTGKYRFVKMVIMHNEPVFCLEWNELLAVLETPVIRSPERVKKRP